MAVQFGPAQRNSISCLGEAATKVLQLQRSSLSHDNSRKIREGLLCLLPYRPILAAAHQCRNRYRHPHCHLPQNHRNRPSKHLPQRGQRQRQRHPQLRGQNQPTWRLSPNPLSQRAIRAANQNQIHRPRPCHKPKVQQPTRRNGAPLSMVVALVRTRSLLHLPCLRASRLRSASERVSYLRSGDRAILLRLCTTMHMYLCFYFVKLYRKRRRMSISPCEKGHAIPEHVSDRMETIKRREIRMSADIVHLITHNTEICPCSTAKSIQSTQVSYFLRIILTYPLKISSSKAYTPENVPTGFPRPRTTSFTHILHLLQRTYFRQIEAHNARHLLRPCRLSESSCTLQAPVSRRLPNSAWRRVLRCCS